jgi:oxygen-independent coproporphyrinogen-3 oxidase
VSNEHEVARRDLPFEYAMNALRLRDGFAVEDFSARTGLPTSALAKALARARTLGLVEDGAAVEGGAGGGRIVPTARGFDFLSDLQALFLPG